MELLCASCKTRKSIRKGSLFEKSHITLQKWLILLYFWAREYPVTTVAEDVGIEKSTACDVYQWLREVCSTKLLQTPITLGGQNVTVQIDESLFRHKPKVHVYTYLYNKYARSKCGFTHFVVPAWTTATARSVGVRHGGRVQ